MWFSRRSAVVATQTQETNNPSLETARTRHTETNKAHPHQQTLSSANTARPRSIAIANLLALPAFEPNNAPSQAEQHLYAPRLHPSHCHLTRSCSSESAPVQVIINGRTTFHIPRALIAQSAYFSSRLSYQFPGENQPIFLFGVDVRAFRIYAAFLFARTIEVPFPDEDDEAGWNAFWAPWDRAYASGFKLWDTESRNELVDKAVRAMVRRDDEPQRLAGVIYRYGEEGSGHRDLARDLALHTWRMGDIVAIREGEFRNVVFRGLPVDDGFERKGVADFLEGKVGVYREE